MLQSQNHLTVKLASLLANDAAVVHARHPLGKFC